MMDPATLQQLGEFLFTQLVAPEDGDLSFQWTTVADAVLLQRWNERNLQNILITDRTPLIVNNTPESLHKILDSFLTNQPPLTRAFHTRMATHFNLHPDKNTAMKANYPNTHGDNQQPDSWESLMLLCQNARDGLLFIKGKKELAAAAFGNHTKLKSDLQSLKRMLPLFLINKITKETLENKAEN